MASLLQNFGRFEQEWRFSLFFIFVFVMTPNFALQTVSATLKVLPVQYIRFCGGNLVTLPQCLTLLGATRHRRCILTPRLALTPLTVLAHAGKAIEQAGPPTTGRVE